jgi:hypothetical protein
MKNKATAHAPFHRDAPARRLWTSKESIEARIAQPPLLNQGTRFAPGRVVMGCSGRTRQDELVDWLALNTHACTGQGERTACIP